MDVPKKSGVAEDVHCGLIVQKNVRLGDGAVLLVESLGTSCTGDTPVSLSWCGEGGFQVALGVSVGYHRKTSKEVISIGIYLKGRHESVHVAAGRFFGADVCMRLADIYPVRGLVGKMTEIFSFESLDLDKVPRLPLAIVGMHFSTGQTVVIILRK